MLRRISQLTTLLGLILLVIAGIFLVMGHNLEAYWYNYQAEVAANFAYTLFVVSFVLLVIDGIIKPSQNKRSLV